MIYGAKGLMWAPFAAENPEPEGVLPNYGAAIPLGELNKVTDNPSYNEARAYGDNALGRYVSEFAENVVDVNILDMSITTASAITGAKIDADGDKDLHFNSDDNAPYGGLAFYVNQLLAGNVKKYQGVFYPKLKSSMQGKEYNTNGESIALTDEKLHFIGAAAKNGDWKILSDYFTTEAEAIAWTKKKLGVT